MKMKYVNINNTAAMSVREAFIEGDKTLLVDAHGFSPVGYCDHLFCLERGRVVEEGETMVLFGATTTDKSKKR
jgi:ABC-type transport system involved in Fe-S cluster assembly fused permease/ATPase subunit